MLCLVLFRSCCYVTSCKMKRSVGYSDLAGGEGPKKTRKPLDFGRRSRRCRATLIARAVLTVKTRSRNNKFEGSPGKKSPGDAVE